MKQDLTGAMQNSAADAVVAGKHGAPLISDARLLSLHSALLQATGAPAARAKNSTRRTTSPTPTTNVKFPAVYASLLAELTLQDRITADFPFPLAAFTSATLLELNPDIATGLAIGIEQHQPGSLVVAFTRSSRLAADAFRKTLRAAARNHAPILYVLLPTPTAPSAFDWSARAICEDVPCIPVDAHDPVALYRVAQETTLRARNHGGPSLIDCKQVKIARGDANPIARMEAHLRRKGLVPQALHHASRKTKSSRSRRA